MTRLSKRVCLEGVVAFLTPLFFVLPYTAFANVAIISQPNHSNTNSDVVHIGQNFTVNGNYTINSIALGVSNTCGSVQVGHLVAGEFSPDATFGTNTSVTGGIRVSGASLSISSGTTYYILIGSSSGLCSSNNWDNDRSNPYTGGNALLWNKDVFGKWVPDNSIISGWDMRFVICSDSDCNLSPSTHIVSGTIATTTTWTSPNATGDIYEISGNVSVNSGVTLTVDPSTIVKFDTATTSSLTVNGTLYSVSPAASSTFFTSLEDDLIGGDTNGDATTTAPGAGDWGGISVNSGGTVTIRNSVIRYGGSGSSPMLRNNGGTLNIATSTIAYGNTYGLKNDSGTTTISASDVAFNTYGLYLGGGSISVTATSTIHDNGAYGAFNATSATSSFFAENNYWATSTATTTGPYNSTYNPDGTGNAVSDFVDFDPWLGKVGYSDLPHYVLPDCRAGSHCGSVPNTGKLLLIDASSSPYAAALNAATSTWNAAMLVDIESATTTSPNLVIVATSSSDVVWKGEWSPQLSQDYIYLNQYYLNNNTSVEVQNTITHEIGHALGLTHSFTGNVMYFLQSSQVDLGPQDSYDYQYLWQ